MVKVSTVTVTYNRPEMVKKCVESLENQSLDRDDYEIIVINQGSEEVDVDSDVLIEAEDKGVAYGRNLGIKESSGDVIAFIDDDCLAREDWLEKGLKELEKNNWAGVEGQVEDDSDRIDEWMESDIWGFVTANIFYRKDVLEEVGLFDERFRPPILREDTDLAWSVLELGEEIGSSEDVVVDHIGGESTKDRKMNISDVLLEKKHPEKFAKMSREYAVSEMPRVYAGWILGCIRYRYPPIIFRNAHRPFMRKLREVLN